MSFEIRLGFVTVTQARIMWEKGYLTEGLPPSECPYSSWWGFSRLTSDVGEPRSLWVMPLLRKLSWMVNENVIIKERKPSHQIEIAYLATLLRDPKGTENQKPQNKTSILKTNISYDTWTLFLEVFISVDDTILCSDTRAPSSVSPAMALTCFLIWLTSQW